MLAYDEDLRNGIRGDEGSGSFVHEDPKKRDVAIDWRLDDDIPHVFVDLIQIQQVFVNLILNVIDAMAGRSVLPCITIRAVKTESNEILIQVIDNGPGVEDPERIFDAFVTTKKTGMWIGLAISRSIVEAHGGRLWAENNPSGGATFSVTLPLSFGLSFQSRHRGQADSNWRGTVGTPIP